MRLIPANGSAKPWVRRPQRDTVAQPDLWRGMTFMAPMLEGAVDVVLDKQATDKSAGRIINAWGPARSVTATSQYINWPADRRFELAGDVEFTIMMVLVPRTYPSATQNFIAAYRAGTIANGNWNLYASNVGVMSFQYRVASANVTVTFTSAAALQVGKLNTVCLVRRLGGTYEVWVNGKSNTQTNATAPVAAASAQPFVLANSFPAAASTGLQGDYVFAALWQNRALNSIQLKELSIDPFLLIRPRSWVDDFPGALAAGGSPQTLAGSRASFGMTARTGHIVAAATLAGSRAPFAMTARTGAILAGLTLKGQRAAFAMTARTGRILPGGVTLQGQRASFPTTARTGHLVASTILRGARAAFAMAARTGHLVAAVTLSGARATFAMTARAGRLIGGLQARPIGARVNVSPGARISSGEAPLTNVNPATMGGGVNPADTRD